MRTLLSTIVVAIIVLSGLGSIHASSASDSKTRFRVNVITPESFVKRTQSGCQYGSGAQTLWVRSSSGDTETMIVFNGTWVGIRSECRFSEEIALDTSSDQTFTFNQREWFTVRADELSEANRIDIRLTGPGVPTYELQTVGIVATVAPTPTPDPETVFTLTAKVDDVELAEQASFSNDNSGYLFTEPWDFYVNSYRFPSEDDASTAMPSMCEHADKQTRNASDGARVKEVSVGRIGDEACAYFSDEKSHGLFIVTRANNHILTVYAFASDGDTVGFTSDWLEGYIGNLPDEADSVMPRLSDMPRGWIQIGRISDVTDETKP